MKKKRQTAPDAGQTKQAAALRMDQATALHRQGKLDEAALLYRRIVEEDPSHAGALLWLGVVAMQKGDPAAAADLIARAVELDPTNAIAHTHAGNALRGLGRPQAALASYDRALSLKSDYPEALANRGAVLRDLKRYDDALGSYDRALALRPSFPEAFYNRGNVLRSLKRPEEALASYDRALALRPAFVEALANRGSALLDLGRYDEALSSCDRALALRPAFAEAFFNRGNTLRELGRLQEALASYERALALNPGYADAHSNRGNALSDLNRHDEALASFGRALALDPDHGAAHWNRGACSLRHGDFEGGWKEFEWRWRYDALGSNRRQFREPLWDGTYLDGTLLAWGEQGLGDQILFLGMLEELAERARELVVAVDQRLVPLVRRAFPRVTPIALEPSLAGVRCDAHVPLGSIGQYLRRGWSDFEGKNQSGYLAGDDARTGELRARLASDGKAVCGLSWFSSSRLSGRFKSVALRALQPLLGLPGWRFVDLQYGDARDEREALDTPLRDKLVRLDDIDNDNDIDGLAALIAACNVVVTVSNVTAHVAGALGRPVLLMLPRSRGRHWYWHENRDDSPWYPGVRLVRQETCDDWAGVVERVKRALEERSFQRDRS